MSFIMWSPGFLTQTRLCLPQFHRKSQVPDAYTHCVSHFAPSMPHPSLQQSRAPMLGRGVDIGFLETQLDHVRPEPLSHFA